MFAPAWKDHNEAGVEKRRWPCCLRCQPLCSAGCGDEAKIVKLTGKLVGAFCRACHGELADGQVPHFPPRVPRKPRGLRLRDLQDQAAAVAARRALG